MPTVAAKIKKLEQKVARLEKDAARDKKKVLALETVSDKQKKALKDLLKCCDQVQQWIAQEIEWSNEVTDMLRQVDWASLSAAFPGAGGTNPPQQPPVWPPK
jgi:hypothetical protein